MKVKRISLLIYFILAIISITLFVFNIFDKESLLYNLSLAFIPSTTIPLLIEIPSLINYKINQIKLLYSLIVEIRKNTSSIVYNIDNLINNDSVYNEFIILPYINKISDIHNSICIIDYNLFFMDFKKKLFSTYTSINMFNLINSLSIGEKKINVIVAEEELNQAINNTKYDIKASFIKKELKDIKTICDDINDLCDMYISSLFNQRIKREYLTILNTIKASMDSIMVSKK